MSIPPTPASASSSYSQLPNELVLAIAEHLGVPELYALIRTNRRNAAALLPLLPKLACGAEYSRTALAAAIKFKNHRMVELLLYHGIMDAISRYNFLSLSGFGSISRRPPHTSCPTEERLLLRSCSY